MSSSIENEDVIEDLLDQLLVKTKQGYRVNLPKGLYKYEDLDKFLINYEKKHAGLTKVNWQDILENIHASTLGRIMKESSFSKYIKRVDLSKLSLKCDYKFALENMSLFGKISFPLDKSWSPCEIKQFCQNYPNRVEIDSLFHYQILGLTQLDLRFILTALLIYAKQKINKGCQGELYALSKLLIDFNKKGILDIDTLHVYLTKYSVYLFSDYLSEWSTSAPENMQLMILNDYPFAVKFFETVNSNFDLDITRLTKTVMSFFSNCMRRNDYSCGANMGHVLVKVFQTLYLKKEITRNETEGFIISFLTIIEKVQKKDNLAKLLSKFSLKDRKFVVLTYLNIGGTKCDKKSVALCIGFDFGYKFFEKYHSVMAHEVALTNLFQHSSARIELIKDFLVNIPILYHWWLLPAVPEDILWNLRDKVDWKETFKFRKLSQSFLVKIAQPYYKKHNSLNDIVLYQPLKTEFTQSYYPVIDWDIAIRNSGILAGYNYHYLKDDQKKTWIYQDSQKKLATLIQFLYDNNCRKIKASLNTDDYIILKNLSVNGSHQSPGSFTMISQDKIPYSHKPLNYNDTSTFATVSKISDPQWSYSHTKVVFQVDDFWLDNDKLIIGQRKY